MGSSRNSAARAVQHCWLSQGREQFRHAGIVVNPISVVFDADRNQLIVVVRALSSDPSAPNATELFLARINAFVVAGSLKRTLPRFSVVLYLRFPNDVDVAVDAALADTAQRISKRQAQLRCQGRMQRKNVIPGHVLAYVPPTLCPEPHPARIRPARTPVT